jgi:hypothetical protein
MFSPKQLLINCITLLCLEHRPGVATSPSNELIAQIIESLPLPEGTVDFDHGRQTFLELRKSALWLNSRHEDGFPSEPELMQLLQISCREESFLYESVASVLLTPMPEIKDVIKLIHSYRGNMQQYLTDQSIANIIKEYSHQLAFKRGAITDVVGFITDMGEKLQPLIAAKSRSKHPAMMGSVDFGNTDEVGQYFTDVKTLLSTEGALRSGWKGLNRMLGKVGAFKRGEFVLISALQHHFKSGFMLSLLAQFCLFNKPWLRDKTLTPLILFVTFENEIPDNLLWLYTYLKESETGQPVVAGDIDINEASAYVSARLRESGFEVKMERFDPTEFTAAGFTQFLDGLRAEGYEIQALLIDYLNMLSKTGIDAKIAGDDIRLLFRRIRNYTSPRGITCITPHQLSSEAMQLTRDNVEDFVKVVANKGYYDGCKRLGQEPDLEIFLHIVRINGKAYLTMQRGKHRNTITAEKDQGVILPFWPVGFLQWDIDKEEEFTLASVGGGQLGDDDDEGGDAWWGGGAMKQAA